MEDFVRSFNIRTEDIPKAMGVLMVAKGTTLAVGLAVGLRYQPLQRLVAARASNSKINAWLQMQRLRAFSTLDRSCKYRLLHIRGPLRHHQRSSAPEAIKHANEFRHSQLTEVLDAAQIRLNRVQRSFKDAKVHWRKAGQKLLLQRQIASQQRKWSAKQLQHSWHGWVSQKYWYLVDAVETSADKNYTLVMLSRILGVVPKTLAVGTVEGLLIAKLAVPLVTPLSLLSILLARKYQGPQLVACEQETSGPKTEE